METDDKRKTATEIVMKQMNLQKLEKEYMLKQALRPTPQLTRAQQAGIAVNDLGYAIDKLIDWARNAKGPMGDMGAPQEVLEEIKVFFRKLRWLMDGEYSSGYPDKGYWEQEKMRAEMLQKMLNMNMIQGGK